MPEEIDAELVELLRREDPNFVPPVADPAARTNHPVPSAPVLYDRETRNRRQLTKTTPRNFWQGERAGGPWDDIVDKGGRPIKQDVRLNEDTGYIDTTVWVEGDVFLSDLDQRLPDHYITTDDELPVGCSVIEGVRHHLQKASSPSYPLALVLEDLPDIQATPGRNHKHTNKRLNERSVHQAIHDRGPVTIRELGDFLLGPHADVLARDYAERKVRMYINRLVSARAIEVDPDPIFHGAKVWRATKTPTQYEAGHPATLGFTKPPEPRRGRYRLTIAGETMLPSQHENRHEALPGFISVCAAVGLHVRVSHNDHHVLEPLSAKPPYRRHMHRRVDQGMAVATINAVRQGAFEPPVIDPETGRLTYSPMLCYFKYWARMLYMPRIVAPSGNRWDTMFANVPEPTREEQHYMEIKAHRMFRELERLGKVVRRKGPDGRTILFSRLDDEANDYPPAWTRRGA